MYLPNIQLAHKLNVYVVVTSAEGCLVCSNNKITLHILVLYVVNYFIAR